PVAGEDREAGEEPRADLRAGLEVRKPREGNLEDVEEEVMVNVVLRVERGERQRVERRRGVARQYPLPEHLAPAEVVVGVVVAAADRAGRELQVPEDRADQERARR